MVYEIINPSDAYTMKHDDPLIAAVACLFLGEGAYSLQDRDGRQELPTFILGGDPEKWVADKYGTTISQVLKGRAKDVADALDSVLIGGFDVRDDVESAVAHMTPEAAAKWLAERHERTRTSMNNIGRRAMALAKAFREKGGALPVTTGAPT